MKAGPAHSKPRTSQTPLLKENQQAGLNKAIWRTRPPLHQDLLNILAGEKTPQLRNLDMISQILQAKVCKVEKRPTGDYFKFDFKQQNICDRIKFLQNQPDDDSNKTEHFKQLYKVGSKVGQGAYASVRVAIDLATNQKVAIKIYEKAKIKDLQRRKGVRREIEILERLSHKNIVKIIDTVESNNHVNIILEYVSGSSLHHFLKKHHERRLDEEVARQIFLPIVEAIAFCHQKSIVHRDIKLENILLEGRVPKLIDFGFSTTFQVDRKVKMFCGTPSYMAPEIVSRVEYRGDKADVWALGVVLYTMLQGVFPFKGESDQELYTRIQSGEYTLFHEISKEAAALLQGLLTVDPELRPSAEEVLEFAWLKKKVKTVFTAESEEQSDSSAKPTREARGTSAYCKKYQLPENLQEDLNALTKNMSYITPTNQVKQCCFDFSYLKSKQPQQKVTVNCIRVISSDPEAFVLHDDQRADAGSGAAVFQGGETDFEAVAREALYAFEGKERFEGAPVLVQLRVKPRPVAEEEPAPADGAPQFYPEREKLQLDPQSTDGWRQEVIQFFLQQLIVSIIFIKSCQKLLIKVLDSASRDQTYSMQNQEHLDLDFIDFFLHCKALGNKLQKLNEPQRDVCLDKPITAPEISAAIRHLSSLVTSPLLINPPANLEKSSSCVETKPIPKEPDKATQPQLPSNSRLHELEQQEQIAQFKKINLELANIMSDYKAQTEKMKLLELQYREQLQKMRELQERHQQLGSFLSTQQTREVSSAPQQFLFQQEPTPVWEQFKYRNPYFQTFAVQVPPSRLPKVAQANTNLESTSYPQPFYHYLANIVPPDSQLKSRNENQAFEGAELAEEAESGQLVVENFTKAESQPLQSQMQPSLQRLEREENDPSHSQIANFQHSANKHSQNYGSLLTPSNNQIQFGNGEMEKQKPAHPSRQTSKPSDPNSSLAQPKNPSQSNYPPLPSMSSFEPIDRQSSEKRLFIQVDSSDENINSPGSVQAQAKNMSSRVKQTCDEPTGSLELKQFAKLEKSYEKQKNLGYPPVIGQQIDHESRNLESRIPQSQQNTELSFVKAHNQKSYQASDFRLNHYESHPINLGKTKSHRKRTDQKNGPPAVKKQKVEGAKSQKSQNQASGKVKEKPKNKGMQSLQQPSKHRISLQDFLKQPDSPTNGQRILAFAATKRTQHQIEHCKEQQQNAHHGSGSAQFRRETAREKWTRQNRANKDAATRDMKNFQTKQDCAYLDGIPQGGTPDASQSAIQEKYERAFDLSGQEEGLVIQIFDCEVAQDSRIYERVVANQDSNEAIFEGHFIKMSSPSWSRH